MSEQHALQIISGDPGAPRTASVGQLVRSAMRCFETDRAAAWRCLNDASSLLGGAAMNERGSAPPGAPGRGGLPKWRAKRVLAYIEIHLAAKIAIEEMANLVALSKSHFARAFRQSFGCSPMSYVATRRLARAKLMMTSSEERLSDIALACGFADQSHLCRHFRRAVGISPAAWRRTAQAPGAGDRRQIGSDRLGCEPTARPV